MTISMYYLRAGSKYIMLMYIIPIMVAIDIETYRMMKTRMGTLHFNILMTRLPNRLSQHWRNLKRE